MRGKIAARCYIKHEGFVTYGDNKILPFSLAPAHEVLLRVMRRKSTALRNKESPFHRREKEMLLLHVVVIVWLPHERINNLICGFYCFSIAQKLN